MFGNACDFFFTGSAILPLFLLYVDEPALAVLAFLALLLAGALCGIADPHAPHRDGARHRRPH